MLLARPFKAGIKFEAGRASRQRRKSGDVILERLLEALPVTDGRRS